MSKQIKTYVSSLKLRYKKARRKEKRVILDEFTKTAGYDRKYAAKLLLEQNSSMTSYIGTASRSRLLLPEAGLVRRMITHI